MIAGKEGEGVGRHEEFGVAWSELMSLCPSASTKTASYKELQCQTPKLCRLAKRYTRSTSFSFIQWWLAEMCADVPCLILHAVSPVPAPPLVVTVERQWPLLQSVDGRFAL